MSRPGTNKNPALMAVLLLAGADASVRNSDGDRPADLVNWAIRDGGVYRFFLD